MDTQKILKNENKIVVIADYREKEVISNLRELGAEVNEMNLEIGDFIASDKIVFERKQHSDFVSSIIDGRIFEQAENLKKNFSKPIVIIEGNSNREITDNALKATIASLLTNYEISLISTKNTHDTAKLIFWTAKKEQEENKNSVVFKVGKKPKSVKRLQEEIVASIPGISAVLSKRLLKHFGSVEKTFSASEQELTKVDGIGRKLAKRIIDVLNKNY